MMASPIFAPNTMAPHAKLYASPTTIADIVDGLPDLVLPPAPTAPVLSPVPPELALHMGSDLQCEAPSQAAAPEYGSGAGVARRRSALAVRQLQRRARTLAEREYLLAPRRSLERPTTNTAELKKRMRNRSAFISRQTGRHYERLLVAHVARGEAERDAGAADVRQSAAEVSALRATVAALEGQVALAKSKTNMAHQRSMGLPQPSLDVDAFFEDDAALGFIAAGVY